MNRDDDLRLTPEECKQMAASFADLPPEYQLSAEELELIQEEVWREPLRYGSPQDAVQAMQRRLALLTTQKAQTLDALEDCAETLRPELLRGLDELNHELAATRQRLGAYRFQQRHQN